MSKELNEEERDNNESLLSRKKYDIKESIENIMLQSSSSSSNNKEEEEEEDEKNEKEEDECILQSPSQDYYYNQYFSNDNDDYYNDKLWSLIHLICICLIILFIFKITYLCYYHSPIIKYTFIVFLLLIIIYPVITDFIYLHMYLIQSYSYNYIKKFGYHIKDYIYNNNKNDIPAKNVS